MIELRTVLTEIAKGIVEYPDQVTVEEKTEEDGTITFTLHVAESDMGLIIGKHGKIAKAIRTVMKAAAKTADKKVVVEIQ